MMTHIVKGRRFTVDKVLFDQILNSHHPVQDPDEFFWLVNSVEALKPESIIEIGVENGGSFKFWEQLLPKNGLLIGVDDYGKVKWDYRNSDRKIYLVEGDSRSAETVLKVKELLNGATIDFLFIDATHTPEAARQDWMNYGQFLRSGGMVGFHDLGLVRTFYDTLEGRKAEKGVTMGTGVWWKP